MTEPDPPRRTPSPREFVGETRKLKREHLAPGELDPALARLRRWQSLRLARTYADLLGRARYGPAIQFFLDELYAPKDFSQRDHDLLQMYGLMRRLLPEAVLAPATLIVRLHELTQQLDDRLLSILGDALGVSGDLTISLYAEAYRHCDNYADRLTQIEWIGDMATTLEQVSAQRLTGATLALARGPARRAGWADLLTFLEQGYQAFRPMRGAAEFVATIRSREVAALEAMYAGAPDPFGFGPEVTAL